MNEIQKNQFKAELIVIKSMVSATAGNASALSQTVFPIVGQVLVIPSLAMAGEALRIQKESMEKLATLLEKVINAL